MTQFKIVHRILATNYNLQKWEIKSKHTCEDSNEIDTVEHFLFECKTVKLIWRSIFKWVKQVLNITLSLDKYEILFGIPNETEDTFIKYYNYIILYTKYYIYCHKKKGMNLDLYIILLNIKNELLQKKECYCANNKESMFDKQWLELLNML